MALRSRAGGMRPRRRRAPDRPRRARTTTETPVHAPRRPRAGGEHAGSFQAGGLFDQGQVKDQVQDVRWPEHDGQGKPCPYERFSGSPQSDGLFDQDQVQGDRDLPFAYFLQVTSNTGVGPG
jgi:hypothetical protein